MTGKFDWPSVSIVLCSLFVVSAGAIDCFKCVSHNGDNPACEDPFHHNYTTELLHQPCLAGRKSREGLFPATACVKITGTFEDSGESMVVRTCALDSGTLTVDTELVRMSHCGSFYFDDRYVRGCVVSCMTDACNSTWSRRPSALMQLIIVAIILMSC
ncbi:uncharacterized protein LOC100906847 [Galendromus occidentalis]|uniref:Uncharacterized protein LOC100906847 n=1 Tax=Galendromus occidentalis TaxID=34638 RepID=A0AAJ6QTL7_9ACAR|nr:uncharacterized protein LOC100906847 [Galendromus occidentalis]